MDSEHDITQSLLDMYEDDPCSVLGVVNMDWYGIVKMVRWYEA